MAETHLPHHEDHDPTVHHEDSDVNVRAILWFTAIFIVLAIVIHVGLWFLLKGFRSYERNRAITPVTEIPLTPDRHIPPQPRLQPFPEPAAPRALGEEEAARSKQEEPQMESNFRNPWNLTPAADWTDYKAAYDRKVNGYGWIDRTRGIVHLPMDEAKRRLLQQGLPSRSALPVAATAPAAGDPGAPTPVTEGGLVDASAPSTADEGGQAAAPAVVAPSTPAPVVAPPSTGSEPTTAPPQEPGR